MIFKRVAANLRARNWSAIGIEFAIVVAGVFVGTQVSNWNADRLAKRETQRMIVRLAPTLKGMSDYYRAAHVYYANTRNYAAVAISGWRGNPSVSDQQFVIAAYQASQIFTLGTNSSTWSAILGTDQLRNIDDPQLRADLTYLMSADYSQIDNAAIDTPYRRNVRRIIPIELQDLIRQRCGDRRVAGNDNMLTLPPRCDIQLPPDGAVRTAALLRGHPELLEDLQWHIAATAALMSNIVPFENAARRVEIKSSSGQR